MKNKIGVSISANDLATLTFLEWYQSEATAGLVGKSIPDALDFEATDINLLINTREIAMELTISFYDAQVKLPLSPTFHQNIL